MEVFFSHARTALKHGLLALGFRAGDEILVPAYICDVAVNPLDELGVLPRYYPVSAELQPAWDSLDDLVSGTTRGFLVAHYFGQPQHMDRCRAFSRKHGLLLIEDNAHGFGGKLDDKLLGTFGDVGISSPRKIMGWRNGGILYWNGERQFPELPEQPGRRRWKMKSLAKQILCGDRLACNFFRKMPDYHSQDVGREAPIPSWKMDDEYRVWLKTADMEQTVRRRQAVWHVWERWALQHGLRSVFGRLSPGANPLAFVTRTASAEESLRWFEWGWKMRLYVHSWPALPRSVVATDKATMTLWETLVCFSIDHGMNAERLAERLGT